jgi:hypothetical protein
MERVRFIEHRGQRVLLLDYSALRDEQPPESVLTLADLTGAQLTRVAMQRVKEANVLDKPFVRRAALVGAETLLPKGALESIGTFALKDWGRFATREEALDWLTAEEANSAAS